MYARVEQKAYSSESGMSQVFEDFKVSTGAYPFNERRRKNCKEKESFLISLNLNFHHDIFQGTLHFNKR